MDNESEQLLPYFNDKNFFEATHYYLNNKTFINILSKCNGNLHKRYYLLEFLKFHQKYYQSFSEKLSLNEK